MGCKNVFQNDLTLTYFSVTLIVSELRGENVFVTSYPEISKRRKLGVISIAHFLN